MVIKEQLEVTRSICIFNCETAERTTTGHGVDGGAVPIYL